MDNIIEGMNVLEQTPIKDYTILSSIFVVSGVLIAILSTLFLMIKSRGKNRIDTNTRMFKRFLFFYVFGLTMAIFAIIHFPWFYVETGRDIYKCTLGDDISANYISNNFNVISVEDGVWTIEDK